ncbi:hypothetical protein BH10BAC3_BH10BAC3_31320 [soil metagenome]
MDRRKHDYSMAKIQTVLFHFEGGLYFRWVLVQISKD